MADNISLAVVHYVNARVSCSLVCPDSVRSGLAVGFGAGAGVGVGAPGAAASVRRSPSNHTPGKIRMLHVLHLQTRLTKVKAETKGKGKSWGKAEIEARHVRNSTPGVALLLFRGSNSIETLQLEMVPAPMLPHTLAS